ncbi:hypothetical protein AKJ09_10094 [Labilithrix luteola]|uniref:Uncharacterized protein n=1 Tax=Labilithrix luteola TaxID=1391654 RepID=A0A0K1QCC3_9BACT|nr:hypothetical protein [Labilithrix luteola]AKV03431.1 hypothetical protein AKJ09_10094 [Labilithrix luteola]
MRLLHARLRNIGPFVDTELQLSRAPLVTEAPVEPEEGGLTVFFGGSGTGKTLLLSVLAMTRPGHALPPLPVHLAQAKERASDEPSYAVTEWTLGDDDPSRQHPLIITSPSAVLPDETAEQTTGRRREQAAFDRRAQTEGGFVFVTFSGARWFSRTPNMLTTPERTLLRHDVRQPASFDDPTRADLTRETKQVLTYATIGRALAEREGGAERLVRFETALREVVDVMLEPFDLRYAGVNPFTLEPEMRDHTGRTFVFDALPRPARHLVALGALSLRALAAAYPNAEHPRVTEGVVAVDDVESQQEPTLLRALLPLFRRALPNVQWLLTTASTQLALAAGPSNVVALRRSDTAIEISEGNLH